MNPKHSQNSKPEKDDPEKQMSHIEIMNVYVYIQMDSREFIGPLHKHGSKEMQIIMPFFNWTNRD